MSTHQIFGLIGNLDPRLETIRLLKEKFGSVIQEHSLLQPMMKILKNAGLPLIQNNCRQRSAMATAMRNLESIFPRLSTSILADTLTIEYLSTDQTIVVVHDIYTTDESRWINANGGVIIGVSWHEYPCPSEWPENIDPYTIIKPNDIFSIIKPQFIE